MSSSTETRGEWLYRKMASIYGERFYAMWHNVDPNEMKIEWSDGLRGLSREALMLGIARLHHTRHCPTLPEFLELCLPHPAMNARPALTDERHTPPEEARKRLAEAAAVVMKTAPGIAWAHKLIARHEAGEHITANQLRIANEAITAWQLTHGTARPQGEGESFREPGCDDEEVTA